STTSRPRATSPSASECTLPCSELMSAATSSRCRSSSSRKRKRIWVRVVRDVSRQAGNARAAAATAAATSSTVARTTGTETSPVAGLKMSAPPPGPATAPVRAPSIQWLTSFVIDGLQSGDEDPQPFARLVLGDRERRGHAEGVAVQAAPADEQAELLGLLHETGGQRGSRRAPGGIDELDGEHQPLAAYVADDGQAGGRLAQPADDDLAGSGGVGLQVVVEHVV